MLFISELPLHPRILEDVQILVVDNDLDNRDLYRFLLEGQGAKVTASGSIQDALNCLDEYIPDLLICETRFLGESVLSLIQRVKALALNNGRSIPILVISTCYPISLAQQLSAEVEAYLLKPIDVHGFIDQVWSLTLLPSIVDPPRIQDWMTTRNLVNRLLCDTGVK